MHAKTVGRLSGIVALAVAFVAVNSTAPFAVSPAEATEIRPVFDASKDRSHEAAQAHLDRFFDFALSPAAAHASPRVQILANGETVWIEPTRRFDGQFSGLVIADGANSRDAITFERTDVRDWTFLGRDRKIYGSFQTRARLAHLSRQNAAPIRAVLASSTTPSNW
ncbi:MAG: hypothetical protein HKN27_00920 [Silicimonas sp.]|nr:hypothetical protein [Silicimonas sp.]